jgi:hypothetical protein
VNDSPIPSSPAAKWLPAVGAAALLGTVVVAGVALGGGNSSDSSGSGDTTVPLVTSETSVVIPDSVPVIETVETSEPITKTQLDRTLAKGMVGDDVKQVQERLTELGFVPGPADGIFGDETRKAVWAYEKLVLEVESNSPTGQITAAMWDDMQEPFVIQPRRPKATPNHTEVYLPEQVLAVFHDDAPVMITHMSSGDNTEWCEEVTISPGEYGNQDGEEPLVRGECGRSITPGGVFTFYRQVEGIRQSSLGGMWNPVYFNYGIAIHGALNVPLQPASHGCIRIPLNISENLQDIVGMGDQVYVWDGVKEPEHYGQQPPTFNWIDPDYETTTTSSSTTTTVPESTTTEAPATTQAPPATTQAPPATTSPPPATTSPPPASTTTTTMTTVAPSPTTADPDGG